MTKKHTVILQPSGRRGQVDEGTSIRAAARELGVEIESICAENATCGKCMVLVEEGRFEKYNIDSKREHLSPVGTEEHAYLARRPKLLKDKGWEIGQVRLSCQCKVLGDVLINVPEESRGNKQIVRKSATRTGDRDQAIHSKILCLDDAAQSRTSHCRLGTSRQGTRNFHGTGPPRRGESAALVRPDNRLSMPADIIIHAARSKMECDRFRLAG